MPPLSRPFEKKEPWQDPSAVPSIVIEDVSKSFGGYKAVNGVSLNIYRGELFSILGASGCGKSTLLRMIAGFEKPSSGRIIVDDVDITDLPAYERPVNMMFQSYALFPHMSVEQNIAFGLKQENLSKSVIAERVLQSLDLVKMTQFATRKPDQLSGGQRQRVALARSIVKRPKILLLDEPMGALDKKLREQTQFELVNIQEEVGITFIMVTHDQEEAMTMSTRMAIMEEGRLWQVAPPHELYEFPNSRYVAEFLGSSNVFESIVVEEDKDHVLLDCIELESQLYITHSGTLPIGSSISVAIRPEKVMMSKEPPVSNRNCIKGVVTEIAYIGDMSIYYIKLKTGKVVEAALPNLLRLSERDVQWEDEVYLFWRAESGVVLTA
jgi:putrescine transport system ATP-binding protein